MNANHDPLCAVQIVEVPCNNAHADHVSGNITCAVLHTKEVGCDCERITAIRLGEREHEPECRCGCRYEFRSICTDCTCEGGAGRTLVIRRGIK